MFNYAFKEHPFKDIEPNDLFDSFKKLGTASDSEYREKLSALQTTLLENDPLFLISFFSTYSLFGYSGNDSEMRERDLLQQPHIEFLQALSLMNDIHVYGGLPNSSDVLENVAGRLKNILQTFILRRLGNIDFSAPSEESAQNMFLEVIREHTQSIRNWGYPQHITHIIKKLFEPLDDRIEGRFGFRVCMAIDMFLKIISSVEDRLSNHFSLVHPVYQSSTYEDVISYYLKSFPDIVSTPDELKTLYVDNNLSVDEFKILLIHHSDLRLCSVYSFSIQDLSSFYSGDIKPEALQHLLKIWSLSFGSLSGFDVEHLFMGNPIWKRPFIELDDKNYIIPVPMLLLSFCWEIFEEVIQLDQNILSAYQDRRAEFLEEEIETVFRAAFPASEVFRGSLWYDPIEKKDFENDLLVSIDSHLIVIEAKSGRVTEPAKRGGPKRLKDTIDKLMVDPSKQSQRFADYLSSNPGIHQFETKSGDVNKVDTSKTKEVIRLNVTLELFGILRLGWPSLRDAGFIAKDVVMAPTIFIADLYIVFDILEGTCEKIHYLIRRTQFETNVHYIGDEIDLLAFYIDKGFCIGDSEFDGTGFHLLGMSESFNKYFLREDLRIDVEKPRRRLTKWWRDILTKFEEKKTSRWTEMSYMLLNVAYEDQVEFEDKFKQVMENVQDNWLKEDHENTVFLEYGPQNRRDAMLGYAFKRINKDTRTKIINDALSNVSVDVAKERIVIIGYDVEHQKKHYPYSFIACINDKK